MVNRISDSTKHLRQLQTEMLGENVELRHVHSEFIHVGFGSADAPVMVIDESPSKGHFTSYKKTLNKLYGGFDNLTAEDYAEFYVHRVKTGTRGWPPFEQMLTPVFDNITSQDNDIFENIYMTSVVKNPVRYDEKKATLPAAWQHTWNEYLSEELEIINPEAVVAVGKYGVAYTISTLSENEFEPSEVKMSQPEWWGEPTINVHKPTFKIPHWNAKKYNTYIEQKWDQLLAELEQFLRSYAFR